MNNLTYFVSTPNPLATHFLLLCDSFLFCLPPPEIG